MNITLYKTSSERHRLSKVLTNSIAKNNCHILDGTSITDPVVVIGYNATLLSHSYAYISDFGRYYFITNMEVLPGQEIRLSLHVDVLMTYKDQIKACKARITRSQSNFDKYIPDNMIINKAQSKITQRKLGAGFTSANKYYIMIGG